MTTVTILTIRATSLAVILATKIFAAVVAE